MTTHLGFAWRRRALTASPWLSSWSNGTAASASSTPPKSTPSPRANCSRAKTDKADAKLIARYGRVMQPDLWTPPPKATRELQALLRRVEHLLEMQQMERNRLDTADPLIAGSLKTVLDTLDKELDTVRRRIKSHIDSDPDLKQRRDLLEYDPRRRPRHRGLAADAAEPALCIRQRQAGRRPCRPRPGSCKSLVSGRVRPVSPKPATRAYARPLYMPILSAWQHNPAIRAFCERLKAQRHERQGRRPRRHAQADPYRLCHPQVRQTI